MSSSHILPVVILLGGLIFVHELGHFLVAKAFRVKVLTFSLGFGPRILGFRLGETDYRLSLLPLGGYVKMAGEDPNNPLSEEDRGRGFLEQPAWKRMLISLAGPAFNLIFPILVYFAVFSAQTEAIAPVVGQVVPGMPAAEAGLLPGDRIVEIEGERIHAFQDLRRHIDPNPGRSLRVVVERDGERLDMRITPTTVEESDPIETLEVGKIGIIPNPAAPVVGITGPGTAAYEAGLRPLDRIAKVAGQEVRSLEDALVRLEEQHARGEPFEVLALRREGLAAGPLDLGIPRAVKVRILPVDPETGERRELGVESGELYVSRVVAGSAAAQAGIARGTRLVALDGEPLRSWQDVENARRRKGGEPFALTVRVDGEERTLTLAQAAKTQMDEVRGRPVTVYTLGAYGGLPVLAAPVEPVPFRPLLAAEMALSSTWEVTRKIAIGIGKLLTGQIAFSNVGGPIQIYDVATKAAQQGWEYFLHTMALISINLGLLNLLPVPVLDGGHILQSGIEMVRRRPLSMRTRELANMVGLAMLLALMIFAMRNDVIRYFFSG